MNYGNKIGIITFHRAVNYGAVLQAYALQETVNRLGYSAVVLDYENPYIERVYDPRNINYKSFKSLLSGILQYSRRKRKKESFESFRGAFFSLEDINLYNADSELLDEYSKFITGSDQVWNYTRSNFDKAYFLDFVSDIGKKNSYAASFGFDSIPKEHEGEYKRLLQDFCHVSVREKQGATIIKGLLNRQAEVVLDPTMLLRKDEWLEISQDYRGKRDYVLIYQMAFSQSMLDFAVRLAEELECEIIYISDALRKRIKAIYASHVSPQEYLGLFQNAKCIVTNSFHGTAFSITFSKPFFVEMLPPPSNVNSRLENILDTFNLRNRQIVDGINRSAFCDIDFADINRRLELERQKSIDYLQRVLEE